MGASTNACTSAGNGTPKSLLPRVVVTTATDCTDNSTVSFASDRCASHRGTMPAISPITMRIAATKAMRPSFTGATGVVGGADVDLPGSTGGAEGEMELIKKSGR